MWWLRKEKKCFSKFSALSQQRFYFLPPNDLDQNQLSVSHSIPCSFHSHIPDTHWQPLFLPLCLHFWAMPTLEYVCSSDFSSSVVSLPSLEQLVSHPAQAGQVPLFCCLGAWCLYVQTFPLFLCDHSWAWAAKTQLTWKTVNLVPKYEMWLMRVDNPDSKKRCRFALLPS